MLSRVRVSHWVALWLGLLCAVSGIGCGDKRGPGFLPPPPPAAPTPPPPVGPFVEGRIVAHHYASHPEWGFGVEPPEPLISRGRWDVSPSLRIPTWVPFWAEPLASVALAEVDAHPGHATEKHLVVICSPGSFAYDYGGGASGTNLARGITCFNVWHVPGGADPWQDVVFVAWRFQPYENDYPLLRALGHEVDWHVALREAREP
jgi:hypothetical protein